MPSYSGGMFQDPANNPIPAPAPKVETKLDLDDDFGFSTVDKNKIEGSTITADRVLKYVAQVTTFLDKLAANPEKDIHWPNRDVKIAEFKDKLARILRGTDAEV